MPFGATAGLTWLRAAGRIVQDAVVALEMSLQPKLGGRGAVAGAIGAAGG